MGEAEVGEEDGLETVGPVDVVRRLEIVDEVEEVREGGAGAGQKTAAQGPLGRFKRRRSQGSFDWSHQLLAWGW